MAVITTIASIIGSPPPVEIACMEDAEAGRPRSGGKKTPDMQA